MASLYELEAMMMCRDKIIEKVLDVFVGGGSGAAYIEAVAKSDQLVQSAAAEELGG